MIKKNSIRKPKKPICYSTELAEKICSLMASGNCLRTICTYPGMPDRVTIWRWANAHPEFRDKLTTARLAHADMLADEVIYIADTVQDAQRARNMIEARKWRAGVINPKQYGSKMEVTNIERLDIREALAAAEKRVLWGKTINVDDDDSPPLRISDLSEALPSVPLNINRFSDEISFLQD